MFRTRGRKVKSSSPWVPIAGSHRKLLRLCSDHIIENLGPVEIAHSRSPKRESPVGKKEPERDPPAGKKESERDLPAGK